MKQSPSTGSEVVERAHQLLNQRSGSVTPGSRKEYLYVLISNALAALKRGDYAIGAVAVMRHRGFEILSLGANSMFSQSDPRGHAEANALGALLALGRGRRANGARRTHPWPGLLQLRGVAAGTYIRKLTSFEDPASSILFTSLEPCPMCTVATLNSGIELVWVAQSDPWAGALSDQGVHDMPPLWSEIQKNQRMRVQYADSIDGADPEIKEIADLAGDLFLATKEPLDRELSGGGLLSLDRVARAVDELCSHVIEE